MNWNVFRTLLYHRKYVSTNPEVRINKRVFESGETRYHLTVKDNAQFQIKKIKVTITLEEYESISAIVLNTWKYMHFILIKRI